MATIDKNLGTVTAYKYAKNAGYEGTEEEFAQGLKNSAEYAGNAQASATAAAGSATSAAESASSAASANTAAQSAKTAAQTAQTAAEAWATGGSGGTPSETNNAQYWSEKSEEWAAAVDPDQLAHIDGSYPDMTVGNAEQLVTNVGVEDKGSYNFRTAGGSAEIGNRVDETVVGGSIVWNQALSNTHLPTDSVLYAADTYTDNGVTFTKNAGGGYTLSTTPDGALDKAQIKIGNQTTLPNFINNGHVFYIDLNGMKPGVLLGWAGIDAPVLPRLYKRSTSTGFNMWLKVQAGTIISDPINVYPQIIDLTQMFGFTIANYIYSLEQANAGAGVSWFRKLFPKDYYAYNAGTMAHVQTSAHETTGFNQYDPATGTALVLGGMQYQITGAYTALSLNGAAVTPDASGLFTPDANGVLTVTGGNSTTTCVHLVYDGSRNGEFEPYVEHVYPLDDSLTLRGIPKLDANDKLYFDGDIYSADGMVTRRTAERAYQSGDESLADAITDGTTTVYLLDTPTTEEADPFQSPQIVDDFGTERYVDYAYEAGDRDFEMPVGHDSLYQANLKAKLEMSPNSPSSDGDYIVRQNGGMNAYVPLKEVRELPTPPTADGTYRLTVTVTDGTPAYSWVQA